MDLSRGDGGIDQPYAYVLPWPSPDPASLPTLPLGRWHTGGWVGAVLTADDVVALGRNRVDVVSAFVDAAYSPPAPRSTSASAS